MSDLLHDDTSTAEARLLRVVALEMDTLCGVGDVVRCDWGVVRDLLDDEVRLAAVVVRGPVTVEESTRRDVD